MRDEQGDFTASGFLRFGFRSGLRLMTSANSSASLPLVLRHGSRYCLASEDDIKHVLCKLFLRDVVGFQPRFDLFDQPKSNPSCIFILPTVHSATWLPQCNRQMSSAGSIT
jgi:hypothetical protein